MNDQQIKEAKKELRKLCRRAGYKIRAISTYTGQSWDNPQSKVFALLVGDRQLNPYRLKEMGFESHFKERAAERWLFYDGVIGMSRTFNIIYNISAWLYKDGYKLSKI